MTQRRLIEWSVVTVLAVAAAGLGAAQESLQALFERGDHGAVVERAADGRAGASEDTYLAALAFMKMGNVDAARGEFRRLQETGDASWQQVGASGLAMLDDNDAEAVAAARRAVEANGDNPFAQYQLGLTAADANDFGASSQALARATELKPDFAYAHYYAAQAFQKQNNMGKASEHYGYFLKLAPDAPERGAVMAIMRTLRG